MSKVFVWFVITALLGLTGCYGPKYDSKEYKKAYRDLGNERYESVEAPDG